MLADVTSQPEDAPVRNAETGEFIITVDIEPVTETNGADVLSYHVEIDDGAGGDYTTIKGESVDDLLLTATK